jgi:hypothetical protein
VLEVGTQINESQPVKEELKQVAGDKGSKKADADLPVCIPFADGIFKLFLCFFDFQKVCIGFHGSPHLITFVIIIPRMLASIKIKECTWKICRATARLSASSPAVFFSHPAIVSVRWIDTIIS